MEKSALQFYDIAANLSDDQFEGIYHGKQKHPADYEKLFKRCEDFNVSHLLISSGNIPDLDKSYPLCKRSKNYYTTAGVHPCRANEAVKNIPKYFADLEKKIELYKDKVVAIGECGLDYDRFHYSSKEDQALVFPPHFDLAEKYQLPMYLHSRNCEEDFLAIVRKNRKRFPTGVVHSFTGTKSELKALIEMDLYIGKEDSCKLTVKG